MRTCLGASLRVALLALLPAVAPPGVLAGPLDSLDIGPEVGAPIPGGLSALDQHGQEVTFKALARERGLVIMFTRSLDW